MRSLLLVSLSLAAAGCMGRREATLPAPIPPIRGDRGQISVTLPYVDFVEGTGALMEPRKCVFVHYIGWLTDGTKFDSSHDPGPDGRPRDPFGFNQGLRRVIMGWDIGFEGMKVGGKRRLFVPYTLAYGEAGRDAIPPRAELIFDVELMAIADTLPYAGPRGPVTLPPAQCPTWSAVSAK